MDTKTCSKCGEAKALSDFYRHKTASDGLTSACKVCVRTRQKEWRDGNKERINIGRRASGYDRQWYAKNREGVRQRQATYEERNAYERYKLNSEARGIDFELSHRQFVELTKSPCHYCGEEPPGGIDRVDNDIPYVVGNVVACCTKCNRFKWRHSVEDFLAHVEQITDFQRSKNGDGSRIQELRAKGRSIRQ